MRRLGLVFAIFLPMAAGMLVGCVITNDAPPQTQNERDERMGGGGGGGGGAY